MGSKWDTLIEDLHPEFYGLVKRRFKARTYGTAVKVDRSGERRRICLRCRDEFLSYSRENRLCAKCNLTNKTQAEKRKMLFY